MRLKHPLDCKLNITMWFLAPFRLAPSPSLYAGLAALLSIGRASRGAIRVSRQHFDTCTRRFRFSHSQIFADALSVFADLSRTDHTACRSFRYDRRGGVPVPLHVRTFSPSRPYRLSLLGAALQAAARCGRHPCQQGGHLDCGGGEKRSTLRSHGNKAEQ